MLHIYPQGKARVLTWARIAGNRNRLSKRMPKVLITGTSTGIGRVAAEVLAAKGWRVFATMRNLEKKGPLERALKDAGVDQQVTIEQLDVNDPASIETATASILAQTGNTLDAVVHNAGVAIAGAHEDLPDAEIRRVMETNFFGVLALTRALLPTFRTHKSGRIVLVSSQSAFAGQPANSIYCASKWALEGWAESIAYELDGFGIDVILIEPGPYRTEIWTSTPRVLPPGGAYTPWLRRVFYGADRHEANNGRDPREVANVIAGVLEASRPRFRYPVGFFARLDHFLRGKLPSRLIRRGTARYLGIPRTR
jgi:NAD(P)-dependent dehydrogenase (short-subunit alcohol dehydrogenase family)